MLEIFKRNLINKPFEVVYVSKEDGHYGASYKFATLEKAEEEKRVMEQAWGAELWDVVIIRHSDN